MEQNNGGAARRLAPHGFSPISLLTPFQPAY
jgi:hypothetical protein